MVIPYLQLRGKNIKPQDIQLFFETPQKQEATISGGCKSGVSAMGITDNIIPYIPKEEGKVKLETKKKKMT